MPSVPRIIVVDPTYEVARIVRGALVLLNRPHILIEVPTAEDALEEICSRQSALVVTAYRISGHDARSSDLATRICHESLGTPVIVLADEGDPLLEPAGTGRSAVPVFYAPGRRTVPARAAHRA